MVLTTMSPPPRQPPPQRGTTLPPNLRLDLEPTTTSRTTLATSTSATKTHTRSHTLPSYSARVQELNQANNGGGGGVIRQNWHSADQPMVSRNAPASVSILSLPNSDNEALNFENR